MARAARFLFGVLAYFFFFAVFLYLIGFVSNELVPRSIGVGPASGFFPALIVDLLLVSLFGIQHSIMARPSFKAMLTKYWPDAIERSLYVAMSALALYLLFRFWLPIPAMVWLVEDATLRTLIWTVAGLGWGVVLLSTFLINHFELFGLRQIWSDWTGKEMPDQIFRQPLFYKLVRHPIYTGFLLAFWATPDMSVGHLVFSVSMTLYVFVGIRYEETDLRANLGEAYETYSQQVGKVIPGLGKAR
ncbi:MAG: isoprenylcysteine carboxylmethyltransferase family protein [Pseudomonadales bacterium]|nr:isoprenylcysteine carboxylmethyltransferase family protein [Pseudomonadales bacterium]